MAAVEPQILTLVVAKVVPGVYRAEALVHGGVVTYPSEYNSLSEAIREEALSVPDDIAHIIEVRYCGLSSGTLRLTDAAERSKEIAGRLMSQLAEMHAIAEH